VSSPTGTVVGADITNVNVSCATRKRVFVTSQLYTGNFGGLAGADARCQERADAAGLGGTYMAWLSDNTGSPSTRFTRSSVPYVLVDGTVVADNWTDLTDGTIDAPINRTELNGAPPNGDMTCTSVSVWTNTRTDGTQWNPGNSCNNWTGTGSALWGYFTLASAEWTTACQGGICTWREPIYCFQQ